MTNGLHSLYHQVPQQFYEVWILIISILSEAGEHTDLSAPKVTKLRISKTASQSRIFYSKINSLSAAPDQYYKIRFPQLFRRTVQKKIDKGKKKKTLNISK